MKPGSTGGTRKVTDLVHAMGGISKSSFSKLCKHIHELVNALQGSEASHQCRRHFPNEDSIVRLIGAVVIEANDELRLQHRNMQIEAIDELNPPAT